MNIASGLGVQQPQYRSIRCEYCGCSYEAIDHPATIAHAIRVHQEEPEHRGWINPTPRSPSFEVRVVQR